MALTHDSETPAKGQQVITACAFIHAQLDGITKVILPKRALTKKFLPGVYELPGGHIEFGEDIVVGLKREINEEFGMEITVGDPFFVFTYINEVKGSHSIEVIYFAQFVNPLEDITIHPDDHSEYGWFSHKTFRENVINSGKSDMDHEVLAIDRGFELLSGKPVNLT